MLTTPREPDASNSTRPPVGRKDRVGAAHGINQHSAEPELTPTARSIQKLRHWGNLLAGFDYPRELPLALQVFSHRRRYHLPAEVADILHGIDGYLHPQEAGLLYWAGRHWPQAGPVVELGSFLGRSTVIFGLAGRQVHAVDAWQLDVSDPSAFASSGLAPETAFVTFQRNLHDARVENCVSVHRGLTSAIVSGWQVQCALLFVDASHDYEAVKSDLSAWIPHLHPAGLLIMHDAVGSNKPGVTRAACDLIDRGWKVVANTTSLVAFTRTKRLVEQTHRIS